MAVDVGVTVPIHPHLNVKDPRRFFRPKYTDTVTEIYSHSYWKLSYIYSMEYMYTCAN